VMLPDNQALVTIIDNDAPAGLPSVTVGDVTVNEDAGTATVQFTLSSTPNIPVTIDYSSANGSAVSGIDYTGVSGTATIPTGSISTTVSLPIINDNVVEATENFVINLSNPTNANLTNNQAIVTILDDDQNAPGGDCNSVTVIGGQGEISISAIPSNAKIEYSGPSTGYQTVVVCDQDCASSTVLTGLDRGNYNVVVQTFDPYCYKLYPVSVTEGGNNNPCTGIGDADGDGICDDVDNCPNIPNAD